MDGKTYYTFKAPRQDVRFFALETDYLTPAQTAWFEKELASAGEDWKIPYFHHPLYSSGARHGSHSDAARRCSSRSSSRAASASSLPATTTSTSGSSRRRASPTSSPGRAASCGGETSTKSTGLTAVGYDTDLAFLVAEIDGDQLFFNAISRTGAVIDSGVIERRKRK